MNQNINICFGNWRRKVPKIFLFFSLELLPLNRSKLAILFSVKEFHTRIRENFYIIFLRIVSSNIVCIALGKPQNAEDQNPLSNRAYIYNILCRLSTSSCITKLKHSFLLDITNWISFSRDEKSPLGVIKATAKAMMAAGRGVQC